MNCSRRLILTGLLLLALTSRCFSVQNMGISGEVKVNTEKLASRPSSWSGLPDILSELNPLGGKDKAAEEQKQPWVEQVGIHPRVFYFHNFLSEEERTHMIRLAAPMMKRSTVAGAHGEGVVDEIRTSYGMFIRRLQDPIIERIERRLEVFTQVPLIHQEDIQVLRYTQGQKYGAHYDSAYDTKDSGPHHRLATFLMYLSDVEEGGETAFPEGSVWADPSMATKAATMGFSDCAKGHVAARPKKGDAVLFYSFFPNKTMDPASMHTGCPVIKGIKWAAPVWIHLDQFEPDDLHRPSNKQEAPHEPGMCEDYDDRCAMWASKGECKNNPGFMIGTDSTSVGSCRRACKTCQPCSATDWDCIHRNRKAEHFLEVTKEEMEWLGVPWWMGSEPSPEL